MLAQKLQTDISVPQKEPKWWLLDIFLYLKIYQNVFAAGALLPNSLGKLSALPRPPSWTWRPEGQEKGGIRKRGEGRERKGIFTIGAERGCGPKKGGLALPVVIRHG